MATVFLRGNFSPHGDSTANGASPSWSLSPSAPSDGSSSSSASGRAGATRMPWTRSSSTPPTGRGGSRSLGDPESRKGQTEHLDLTDFNESDTRVSENFHSYLNNSFQQEETSFPERRYPARARRQDVKYVPQEGGGLARWKDKVEMLHNINVTDINDLRSKYMSLPHLASLDSYFSGHIWFDENTVNTLRTDDFQPIQTMFLNQLAEGREIPEAKSLKFHY